MPFLSGNFSSKTIKVNTEKALFKQQPIQMRQISEEEVENLERLAGYAIYVEPDDFQLMTKLI